MPHRSSHHPSPSLEIQTMATIHDLTAHRKAPLQYYATYVRRESAM
ncbi:MAG TPA: hypothetical protein VI542_07850 [Candidatus Tectomicrobia bacterium]